jgi:hypothetical protein
MARARNIKPSFFKNELLAEMDAFDRLLFVGLWCLADREGRIEDRPKRIKMELFPCDGYDVDAGLANLEKHGFVTRYQAGEVAVVAVVNFHKHQTPHGTEKDSELPDENGDLTINERTSNGYVAGKKRVNNVNPQESNGHPPLGNCAGTVNPPGHNTLNPDSLNPDSLKEAKASMSSAKPAAAQPCPHTELIDLFGKHLPMLSQPKPELWSGKKADAMRARWKWVLTAKKRNGQPYAASREEALDFFDRYFAYVAKSDFLTGRDGKWTGCNLGWLMTEAKFSAVIEGNYDNRELEVA